MKSPLEGAARAAAEEYGEDWDALPALNPIDNGEMDQQQFIDIARAVLQAIREPSRAMTDAGGEREYAGEADGEDVNVSAGDYAAGVIYRAMIDAALEEG